MFLHTLKNILTKCSDKCKKKSDQEDNKCTQARKKKYNKNELRSQLIYKKM